jgi:uncharacterized membrane protein
MIRTAKNPASYELETASRPAALAAWIDRWARVLLTLLIVGYIVVIGLTAVRKFQLYRMGFDLALIQQAIWNTIHGRPFETLAYDHTANLLGTDSFFVLLVLAPFYALVPNPATLLVVQTVIVATSAIPVYLLARDHLRQRWAALAIGAVFLLYQPALNGNLYEVRERIMAMAWMLWLLLCIERRWYWRMLIPLALMLSCRLDTTIGVALLGVYALLLRYVRPRAGDEPDELAAGVQPSDARLPLRYALTLIGGAAAWYLFVTQIMVPSFTTRPGFLFLEHYSYLGDSPPAIVLNVVTHPLNTLRILFTPEKLWYLLGMFLPLAFLSLLNWRLLLIMIPLYGVNLLSPRKIQWDVYHHYQGLIVPLMLLAAILGIKALARRRALGRATLGWLVAVMLLGTVLSHALYGNQVVSWTPDARAIAANELIAEVPADAPIAAGNLIAPHLPARRAIYLVPGGDFFYVADPFAKAEYALTDIQPDAEDPRERDATLAAIEGGGWCRVDQRAEYVLLKKQAGAHGEQCAR